MDWHTIESAPKNGAVVLLFFPGPTDDEDRYKVGFWSGEYSDWFASEASSASLTEFGEHPSHWAALEPP